MSHGNWGKTPRSKNHFDHIKQVTRRTVLLATKTPIKSKSNKFLPKKTPMAPWEHREVQATKISFLGQKKMLGHESDWELERRHWLKIWRLGLKVFSKNLHVLNKSSDLWSRQIHPNACPLYTHETANNLEIFNTIYYQPAAPVPAPVPAPTATRTPTRTNKKSHHRTTVPHRPSDTKSPLRSKRSPFLRQVEPTAENRRPNPWPGFLGIIGVEGGPSMWGPQPEFMWMIAINIHDSPGVWHFIHIFILFFSRNPYPKFIMEMSNACYPSCTHPVAPVGTNIIIHQARLKEFSTHTPIQL